jgi:excisionase family DNA binding protein
MIRIQSLNVLDDCVQQADAAMKQSYSPKEVALAVGVSESSLKRWADDGRLEVSRTMGGHRRISLQEAIRFARESRLAVVRPDVLGMPELAKSKLQDENQAGEVLFALLREGKSAEARAVMLDLYLRGQNIAMLCDGPVREAMSRLGQLYLSQGHKGIFTEHRATDIVVQGLSMLRLMIKSPSPIDEPPVALGGCPEGDQHMLSSISLACVVAETGYRDVNLGPSTPMDTLLEAIQTHRPRLVWMSLSVPEARPSDEELRTVLTALEPHNGVLAVGGRGFDPKPPPSMPRFKRCATLSVFAAFASGLLVN